MISDSFWDFLKMSVELRPWSGVSGDEALDGDAVADHPPERLGSLVNAVLAAILA